MSKPEHFRELPFKVNHPHSCRECDSIEGQNYCLLHTFGFKNATLHTCNDWTEKKIPEIPASDQLRQEIHNVVRRYGQESDVSVYQAIGALEAVKMDLWEELERVRGKH